MRHTTEIALAFPRGAHQEAFIEGVLAYAEERDLQWSYLTALESSGLSVRDLEGWTGSGVIAALNTAAEVRCAFRLGIPIVNVSGALRERQIPSVLVDNVAIGAAAARHFRERGFRRFAFLGLTGVAYSELRWTGFRETIRDISSLPECLLLPPTFRLKVQNLEQQNKQLASWIAELDQPIALFAVTDYRARQVLQACRTAQRRVPTDIAIIGVDNETVTCCHARPTLSSVDRNNRLEGYTAAATLDMIMQGDVPSVHAPQLIPPKGVVARESTGTFAIEDARLRSVLVYADEHIAEGTLGVDALARHANVSRRWLEYAFRETMGQTPYQFLQTQRLERARGMLADEPHTRIHAIAKRNGFSSAKHLAHAFRRAYGCSPQEFQRSSRNNIQRLNRSMSR